MLQLQRERHLQRVKLQGAAAVDEDGAGVDAHRRAFASVALLAATLPPASS